MLTPPATSDRPYVKQAPLPIEAVEPESPPKAQATGILPHYVMVYSFVVWDHDRNATVIYPRMATPAAIAKMRGKVNEDTAWVVDSAELDVEGFYSGDRQPGDAPA